MTHFNGVKNVTNSETQWQKISTGQDEDMRVYGFEKSTLRRVLTYISYVLTIGWVRLFFHWYPQFHLYATHRKCPLSRATRLLITDNYQGKYKSYFVKDIRIISTKNISTQDLLKSLGTSDEDIVEKFRERKLKVNLENGTQCEVFEYRAFWCKKQCYVWDVTQNTFSKLVGFDKFTLCSDLHHNDNPGLSKEEQCLRRIVYDDNEIVVPVQSIGVLFVLEVLNPFYIFQAFTLTVWCTEGYIYYTGTIFFMSLFGITSSIMQTRKNQINLRGTVASSETVRVRRSTGAFENIPSSDLVPGDIIELPKHQSTVICDAVLLSGQCILNESMLTGESVPVTKTPLPTHHILYDSKLCAHHTIYSGTTIIQTRYSGGKPVLARVIRTGFQTSRGGLVAAILYPPPTDFKFDQDSYKFIGILACIAICGFIYTVVTKISRGITPGDIAIKAIDVITIVIPPALPAVMTVGKLYAQGRLKREQIYCINNKVINVSGSINCVCFDKTGTLTEDGLDMWGIVPCTEGILGNAERSVPKLNNHPLFEGMLVCHSLNLIEGEICGDPLDIKMFESTEWQLEESNNDESNKNEYIAPKIVKPSKTNIFTENMNEISEIEIVQQYQFSSSLQRMSVIVRAVGCENFIAYTKGSPEMILSLSRPETVPKDIMYCLRHYTEQGYRVIAMGRSILPDPNIKIANLSRDFVEQNLEFLGLVILENRLKAPTIPVIKKLRDANIHVLMITGDNIQTAVSVAKDCGILAPNETVVDVTVVMKENQAEPKIYFTAQAFQNKEFVIPGLEDIEQGISTFNYRFVLTGQSWQLLLEYFPDIVPKICVRGAIFARMSSDQKQQLVCELMQLGYYVAMCGDGANDCGALRAAHVGISLSEAESSVASPFTSKIPDITCVPKVIRQGRAALVTSLGIFKYMVTYSLTEFASVIFLYSIDSNLSDVQFLFIDVCLVVNFASFFGKTQAYEKKLADKPPMTSLLGFTPVLSFCLHMLIIAIFQGMVYHMVRVYSWFTPYVPVNNFYAGYENYSIFCISMFQYIMLAIIFSRGKPYRQAIYTNYVFLSSIVLLTIICTYMTIYPAQWICDFVQLKLPPTYEWRVAILMFAFANFIICFFVETFVIEHLIERHLKPLLYKPEKSKKKYLRVEHELKSKSSWPNLNKELPTLPITPSVENIIRTSYSENPRYANS